MQIDYEDRFRKLRSDASPARWPASTRHRAPHKPFMLLAVMDLIAQEIIQTNFIEFNNDLLDVFDLYWTRIMGADKPTNPVLPFFHLRSDGFWHLIPRLGKEQVLQSITQIRARGQLQDLVLGAKLDEGLFWQMQDQREENRLRTVIIESYFVPELRPVLIDLGEITAEAFQYSFDLVNSAKERFKLGGKRLRETGEEYKPEARSVAFRRVVVNAYNCTCAMCRIRLMTPEGRSAVVAAHIVPWSESYNDDPRNGISLCGLHHWVFDEGLVTVSDDHLINVSKAVSADTRGTEPLLELSGRKLHLPESPIFWPAEDALSWHRTHTFRSETAHRLI